MSQLAELYKMLWLKDGFSDQSFGVSLVDISKNTDDGIPRIVQAYLLAFEESKYWTQRAWVIFNY